MYGIVCAQRVFDFALICARPAANNYVRQRKAYHFQPLPSVHAASRACVKGRVRRRVHGPRHGLTDAAESFHKTARANRSADYRVWCVPAPALSESGSELQEIVAIDVKLDGIVVGVGLAGNSAELAMAECGMNVLRLGRGQSSTSTTADDPEKWPPVFGKLTPKQETKASSSDRAYQPRRLKHECRARTVSRGGAVRQPLSRRRRLSQYQRACAQRYRRSCFSREGQPRGCYEPKDKCKVAITLDDCIRRGIYRAVG